MNKKFNKNFATNRIMEVMLEHGFTIRPTPQSLASMNMTLRTWNKIVDRRKDPEFHQVPLIAEMIGCEIKELFEI